MKKTLSSLSLNPCLLNAEYAVRGHVPQKAAMLKADLLKNPGKYPFDSLLECHLGNPMALGQKYLSFGRQVMDLVLNPHRANPQKSSYHPDVVKRAQSYLKQTGRSIGAFGYPNGMPWARESAARFVERRDGVSPRVSPDEVLLANGAACAISAIMSILIDGPRAGIMIPIPQYPLYSATIDLLQGQQVGYYLTEDAGWELNVAEL